jgi:hypothetical protein
LCQGIVHEQRAKPGQPNHVFRVVTHVTLHAARAKKATLLFDAPVAVTVLDAEEPFEPLFALGFELRPGGRELVVSEPASGACEDAAKKLDDDVRKAQRDPDAAARTTMTAWAQFDRSLLAKLCKAIGTYAWRNDRFARAPVAGPPPSGASGP